MSALVRHHFSTIVNATQSLRPHPLSVRPILRQPPTWAGFGSAFAGLRTGIGREVGHGARQTSRSAQRSRIVSLGTPSLLFHDRRAPRPHQISRSGPIALQVHAALFHASRPNQGLPFIWLATVLKTSTALAFAQTAGRITMSLLPVIFLKLKFASRFLRKVPADHPHYAQKREKILRIRWKLWVAVGVLVVVPLSLFVSAILASLERTPLTGRVRLIMLSAEEEEEIARELKGAGWYTSVAQILVNASPSGTMPRVIPPDDWRWNWVEQTLRQLERAVPKLQEHSDNPAAWYAAWVKEHPGETHAHLEGPEWKTSAPIPPPPHYPLVPARALRSCCMRYRFPRLWKDISMGMGIIILHMLNLVLLIRSCWSIYPKVMRYRFGGDGGGGIVVYSGFLDEVLGSANKPSPQPKLGSKSLLTYARTNSETGTLLAHELSHLLLSHHLETLSSGTIFLPSVIGIVSDVVRVLLFPITMVMGPFVNDAVANFTKVGLDDIARSGSTCQSRELEFEADISSGLPTSSRYGPLAKSRHAPPSVPGTFWTSRSAAGEDDSHPLDQARVHRLKRELRRWEREKAYAMGKMKIDSWARGACEASIKGLKWKLDKQPCKDQNWE
ncbi:Peptidase family M48 protein [Rhizoctonia solani]|uniref:Peptidase family M48 protein n=1 Tax=Rhizoctonia solani TaxID=456999 RepID=A0A8H8NU31_9AGAM|nr:Peptidase family M48 protein [Rhizoctonia solani]QRW18456.1 Peptidase family M48 protein [Rhizoctonia solani]